MKRYIIVRGRENEFMVYEGFEGVYDKLIGTFPSGWYADVFIDGLNAKEEAALPF